MAKFILPAFGFIRSYEQRGKIFELPDVPIPSGDGTRRLSLPSCFSFQTLISVLFHRLLSTTFCAFCAFCWWFLSLKWTQRVVRKSYVSKCKNTDVCCVENMCVGQTLIKAWVLIAVDLEFSVNTPITYKAYKQKKSQLINKVYK